MERRTKIIIIGAVILLILVLLILWLIFRPKSGAPTLAGTQNPASAQNAAPANPSAPLSKVTNAPSSESAPAAQSSIETIARSFAERYGSYSNQSNFENIENLLPFMTDVMRVKEEANLAQMRRAQASATAYNGVTTRVLSIKIISRTSTDAILKLTTQRTESGASLAQPRVYYQDIELTLMIVGEQWKVGAAVWK